MDPQQAQQVIESILSSVPADLMMQFLQIIKAGGPAMIDQLMQLLSQAAQQQQAPQEPTMQEQGMQSNQALFGQ